MSGLQAAVLQSIMKVRKKAAATNQYSSDKKIMSIWLDAGRIRVVRTHPTCILCCHVQHYSLLLNSSKSQAQSIIGIRSCPHW